MSKVVIYSIHGEHICVPFEVNIDEDAKKQVVEDKDPSLPNTSVSE